MVVGVPFLVGLLRDGRRVRLGDDRCDLCVGCTSAVDDDGEV